MCEFCTTHGDGQVWFKNAENYSKDLMADLERRQYVRDFLQETIGQGVVAIGRLETIYQKKKKLPRRLVQQMIDTAKADHFGQVVTIEDIREIVGHAATIVRLPCACRWASMKQDRRYCYSVSYSPEFWYNELDMSYFGKAQSEGLETVTKEQAIRQMEELEQDGAVHTIWTMKTPFIGAICNCTPHDCLGLRTLAVEVETMFRGEQVAQVDEALCNGCGECQPSCHFGAISSRQSAGRHKATIDPVRCFGCGLCRNSCPMEALSMQDR